ncbi:MAG TPA: phosphotransferase [Thiobacillus sp.]|nr:phosphotransferase [Thiobacillus sp.]
MEESTYIYSQLSSYTVLRLVVLQYDLPETMSCKFYVRGLHDNYLIESKNKKFILRIYRNNWRSGEEIGFELDLLRFLGNKAALVAFPLGTKIGELSFFIDSPEGKRSAALFNYADGHAPGNEISIEEGALLGNSVANIHRLTDAFHTNYTRPILDIPHLLDESIIAIEPFVNTEFLTYLKTLQNKLHHAIPSIIKEQGIYGICIGDVNPTNFHVNEKKQLTLFDFDQCGYGYRAFEIGKFISSIHTLKTKNDIAKSFMDGYQQVRQLSREEVYVIPYFEMISVIWVMAINVNNVELIGHKWLEKPFWDRKLSILKELDSVVFIK